jgi:hypothetical protein
MWSKWYKDQSQYRVKGSWNSTAVRKALGVIEMPRNASQNQHFGDSNMCPQNPPDPKTP